MRQRYDTKNRIQAQSLFPSYETTRRRLMTKIATGLDQFKDGYWRNLKGQSLGLLANQASVDENLVNTKNIVSSLLPGQLKFVLGPQHGFWGEDQDNMIETEDSLDPELHIPVVNIYGSKIRRLPQILKDLDFLIIDLQDVGTRVYTFAATVLQCLKDAAKAGKRVLILDRPNPLGGAMIEGNVSRMEFSSLVGPFTLPMRHGMTLGELAYLLRDALTIGCDITVLPLQGWQRRMLWGDIERRWISPSPNMPLATTAQVYPGQVLWEGTNISEGRGTCRPFEVFGAPFIEPVSIQKTLPERCLSGCCLREYWFRPTFHKWEGQRCGGLMIHVLDASEYRPFRTSLALLKAVMDIFGEEFCWKEPPYEYEFNRLPIDLIFGDSSIRMSLEKGMDVEEILEGCYQELKEFLELRRPYLLYKE